MLVRHERMSRVGRYGLVDSVSHASFLGLGNAQRIVGDRSFAPEVLRKAVTDYNSLIERLPR